MTTKLAITACLGLVLAASTAQAQFRIGVDVSSNFGSAPLRGTPTYVFGPYYDGWSYYYAPDYYAPGYYYSPSSYYYSPGASYYLATPGISIGVGRPYWGRRA